MPEITVTAFKWTGNYYNAQYDESHEVTFSDDDDSYDGRGDVNETVSIDGGADTATWGQPYSIDVSFDDTEGEPHVETFYFFNAEGDWYFIPLEGSEFSEGATLGTYQSHTTGWNYEDAVCFVSGTKILTDTGYRPVEELSAGHRVATLTGAFKPLKLNLRRQIYPVDVLAHTKLAPVRIDPGALGKGVPEQTIWVSRQHRMLVRSKIAERMFNAPQVLVAAIKLTGLPGIDIDRERQRFSYHHLVFEEHEIIYASAAPSESFLPGPQALASIPQAARDEFQLLFPDAHLASPSPAAPIPPASRQKSLVKRHRKNGLALVS
ncbi:MAG: Hint domain-containing protein [Pseudomonadota bacterium]